MLAVRLVVDVVGLGTMVLLTVRALPVAKPRAAWFIATGIAVPLFACVVAAGAGWREPIRLDVAYTSIAVVAAWTARGNGAAFLPPRFIRSGAERHPEQPKTIGVVEISFLIGLYFLAEWVVFGTIT